MKVLFTFGGMPHYLVALLKKIDNWPNTEVVVVIPSKKGQTIGKGVKLTEEYQGINTIYADEYKSFFGKPYFRGFRDIVIQERPDIIVTGWPYIVGLSFDLRTLLLIKRKKTGLIFREIPFQVAPFNKAFSYYKENPLLDEDMKDISPKGFSFYPWAFFLKYTRKWYYSIVDATLAYAECATEIQGSYGVKSEKIFISLNSPDTDELLAISKELKKEETGDSYNPYRIIHVGRLVKWKRVDLLIDALVRLKPEFPKAELLIIGTGPEEEQLKVQIKNKNIEDSVRFAGAIYKPEELARQHILSGIYVLAGMGGLSINEAMAFGKPVICSVCDGTEKSLVKEGYNGLYFKNGSLESLTEKIGYLFANLDTIKEMGLNSERIIKEEINLDTVASKFREAFNYVLQKKGKIYE